MTNNADYVGEGSLTLSQRYVSDELTHFVERGLTWDEQYSLLAKIIRSGILKPSADANNKLSAMAVKHQVIPKPLSSNESYYPWCVCFCDIPTDSLELHMGKYSRFGLSFPKPFLVEQGVHPVFYISNNSQVRLPKSAYETLGKPANLAAAFDVFWDAYDQIQQLTWDPTAMNDEVRKIAGTIGTFLDFNVLPYLKFFDDNLQEDDGSNFYMEREWRVLGLLCVR